MKEEEKQGERVEEVDAISLSGTRSCKFKSNEQKYLSSSIHEVAHTLLVQCIPLLALD